MRRHITTFLLPLFALLALTAACGDSSDSLSTDSGNSGTGLPDSETTDTSVSNSDEPDPETPAEHDGDDMTEETLPDGPLGAGVLATINVTISHPDADDVVYSVVCLGDTASLTGNAEVNEQTACSRLGDPDVRSRLLNGVPADQICTEIYGGPDLATITGNYDGVDGPEINTTVDRANGCGIDDWDNVLAGILPPAKGL